MGEILIYAVVIGLITKLTLGSWLIGIIGTPVTIYSVCLGIAIHRACCPERYVGERKSPEVRSKQKDDVPTIDEIAFWDACLGDD